MREIIVLDEDDQGDSSHHEPLAVNIENPEHKAPRPPAVRKRLLCGRRSLSNVKLKKIIVEKSLLTLERVLRGQ